jgi:hypothetical protein
MPGVHEGSEGDERGEVLQTPEDGPPLRRERNHGSEPEVIPGVDQYLEDLGECYDPG